MITERTAPAISADDATLISIYHHSLKYFSTESLWFLYELEPSPVYLPVVEAEIEFRAQSIWKKNPTHSLASLLALARKHEIPVDLKSACELLNSTADEVEATR